MMNATDISALARQLFAEKGAGAIAHAARQAALYREAGEAEQARIWQRVEGVIRELRGPHQS